MLYSGLRPGEVKRLQPERDVIWQERVLVVRPVVSKTGGGRMVSLRLPETMVRQECTIPRNWEQKWRALRRAAGVEHWVPVLRREAEQFWRGCHIK